MAKPPEGLAILFPTEHESSFADEFMIDSFYLGFVVRQGFHMSPALLHLVKAVICGIMV